MIGAVFGMDALRGTAAKKVAKRPAIGPQLIGTVIPDIISISLEGPAQSLPVSAVSGFNRPATTQAHVALQEDRDMRAQTSIRQARPG